MFREFLEERYRKKFESEYHLTNEDAELLARFFQRKETLPESNEPDHPNHMELLDLQKAQVLSVMTPLERAKRHSKRLADNVDVWVICGILVVAFAGIVACSIDTPGRGVRPSYDRLAIDGDPPERDAFDCPPSAPMAQI